MSIRIKADGRWNSFDEKHENALIPIDLLYATDIRHPTKLLYIALSHQINRGPLEKADLDRRMGFHRSTRTRYLKELADKGLITVDDEYITMHHPSAVLPNFRESSPDDSYILSDDDGLNAPTVSAKDLKVGNNDIEPEYKPEKYKDEDRVQAANSWNKNKPTGYSQVYRMCNTQIMAIKAHLENLGLESNEYDLLFTTLRPAIESSEFWMQKIDRDNKNISAIMGSGFPEERKFKNVLTLYNRGLSMTAGDYTPAEDSQKQQTLPKEMKPILEEFWEIQDDYQKTSEDGSQQWKNEEIGRRIIELEKQIKSFGYRPSEFRRYYENPSWPHVNSIPPSKTREFPSNFEA